MLFFPVGIELYQIHTINLISRGSERKHTYLLFKLIKSLLICLFTSIFWGMEESYMNEGIVLGDAIYQIVVFLVLFSIIWAIF